MTIRKLLMMPLLLMTMAVVPGTDTFAVEEDTLSLSRLIDEALAANPNLRTKENQVKAMEQRIDPAGALPDPSLKLGLLNVPDDFDFNSEPMTQKQIGLSQKLPFPGKLGLKETIAEDEYLSGKAEYEYRQLETINSVKMAYFSLFFNDKSIDTTNEIKTVMEGLLDIARIRYSVGKGIQQDVMQAEVELSRLRERLVTLNQQRITIQAQLNTLLNRAPSSPLAGRPVLPESHDPDQALGNEFTLTGHPLLESYQFAEKKARDAHHLALKDYYPDFEVSVAYGQREGSNGIDRPDFFTGVVGISIPLWFKSKQSKLAQATQFEISSAEKKYQAIENDLQFRISSLMADIEQNRQLIGLYRDAIIPQAESTLDSSIDSYQVGSVDFLTLLTNLQTLYRYELEYYRVRTEYEKNLADLELAVGKRLF